MHRVETDRTTRAKNSFHSTFSAASSFSLPLFYVALQLTGGTCGWLVGYNFPFGGNHDGCDSDPTCLSESVFQLYYSKAWVPSEGKMSIFPHIADIINTRAHSSHTQAVELRKQMNDGVRTDLFASVWPTLNETVETTSQRVIIARWNPPTTAGDLGAVFLSRGLGDLLRETVSFSPWMWSVSALLSLAFRMLLNCNWYVPVKMYGD